jgi:transcription factor SFP1
MTGTSPFTFNSPSYHSSSYLPKLEAEFCRDFSCCGIPLPSLHDLLRHYEEHHAQQIPIGSEDESQDSAGRHDVNRQQSRHPQQNAGITSPIGAMGGIQYEMMRQQQMQRQRLQDDDRENSQDDQQDGEIAGDMEMDDDMTPPPSNSTGPITPQGQLPQQPYSHPPTPQMISHPSYHNTPNLANAQLAHLTTQPSHFFSRFFCSWDASWE